MQQVEERESVTLTNEGKKIFGVLHLPSSTKKAPAVLMCHGLAGNKTGKYRLYVTLSEVLAEAGIASLRIDFRGSGDSEGAFSEMTLQGEVSDTLLAFDYLKNHPGIDGERLGLFGRSLGGTVAVMAAHRNPLVKSLALWAPMFSAEQWADKWHLLHSNTLTGEQNQALMVVSGQQGGYNFFKELFALDLRNDLESLREIPLLHIHCGKDTLVNEFHANQYKKAREHASGSNKFIVLPNSDHEFSDMEERKIAIDETVAWYKNTL